MNRYKSIFLSDFHLGSIGCRATALLAFLQHHHAETVYLIGDIVDTWSKRRWVPEHLNVLYKIASMARKGANIFYMPGNHDGFIRGLFETDFGNIHVCEKLVHTLSNGKKLLVLHGDSEDDALKAFPWMSRVAAHYYGVLQALNQRINTALGSHNSGKMGLFAFLKHAVKRWFTKTAKFEKRMLKLADSLGCEGVICGHMHQPALKVVDGLVYANVGDWVESCTALVEHFDGTLEILADFTGNKATTVDRFATAVVL